MVTGVADERLRWLLGTCARLVAAGAEPASGLVLPNERFFPDRFDGSRGAVEQLMARVLALAGLGQAKVELHVTEADGGSACSSQGCCSLGGDGEGREPRVRRAASADGYAVSVDAAEIRHPVVLTTGLARASSAIFLDRAGLLESLEPHEREATVDVAAVLLGFGVLLSNGSYLYSKSCGGVRVRSATALPVEEVTTLLAICCQLFRIESRAARAELDTTPRASFGEALSWARANAATIGLVRSDREAVEAGRYRLAEPRSWFSRLFGSGRDKSAKARKDVESGEARHAREPTEPRRDG